MRAGAGELKQLKQQSTHHLVIIVEDAKLSVGIELPAACTSPISLPSLQICSPNPACILESEVPLSPTSIPLSVRDHVVVDC